MDLLHLPINLQLIDLRLPVNEYAVVTSRIVAKEHRGGVLSSVRRAVVERRNDMDRDGRPFLDRLHRVESDAWNYLMLARKWI